MNTPVVAILAAIILFFVALFGVFSIESPVVALAGLMASMIVMPFGLLITLFRMS